METEAYAAPPGRGCIGKFGRQWKCRISPKVVAAQYIFSIAVYAPAATGPQPPPIPSHPSGGASNASFTLYYEGPLFAKRRSSRALAARPQVESATSQGRHLLRRRRYHCCGSGTLGSMRVLRAAIASRPEPNFAMPEAATFPPAQLRGCTTPRHC